jgi:hypothetical protein
VPILVGIDGTGDDWLGSNDPSRNKHYDDEFANSFVKRICARHSANTIYFRGPGFLPANNGLLEAVWKGRDFILSKRRAGVNEPILLTGYSRGATAAVNIAKVLDRQKLDVKAMLLFDCVDRAGANPDPIPNNVKNVLHVMRSPESGSRGSFGHAATEWAPPTLYKSAIFTCTHGGMGGVPWTVPAGQSQNDFIDEGFPDYKTNVTYAQDARGAERVWTFVETFLREHGFPIPTFFPYSSCEAMRTCAP